MNVKDISRLMRFVGFAEGMAYGLKYEAQDSCWKYAKEAEKILREELERTGGSRMSDCISAEERCEKE